MESSGKGIENDGRKKKKKGALKRGCELQGIAKTKREFELSRLRNGIKSDEQNTTNCEGVIMKEEEPHCKHRCR